MPGWTPQRSVPDHPLPSERSAPRPDSPAQPAGGWAPARSGVPTAPLSKGAPPQRDVGASPQRAAMNAPSSSGWQPQRSGEVVPPSRSRDTASSAPDPAGVAAAASTAGGGGHTAGSGSGGGGGGWHERRQQPREAWCEPAPATPTRGRSPRAVSPHHRSREVTAKVTATAPPGSPGRAVKVRASSTKVGPSDAHC